MFRPPYASIAIISAVAVLMSPACNGDVDGFDGDADTLGASANFPRLTHSQWENTVQALFRLEEPPGLAATFQPDPPLGRFDNNIARLQVTSGQWSGYQRAAEEMAARVVGDPSILDSLAPSRDIETLIRDFVTRAFRRPTTETEIARYKALAEKGPTLFPDLDSFDSGARLVIAAVLQSPFFLYRTELSGLEEAGISKLSGYEVASRLSYTFLNTMPNATLFEAAAAGNLDSVAGIESAVDAILDDPRAIAQFGNFHTQAFSLTEWADIEKSAEAFPEWRREIGVSMQTEMKMFLAHLLFSGGTIRDLLTSRTTFVDADLAAIYGLDGEFDDEFVQVELDPSQRTGFMTRSGFLTKNATLTQPDPIHRGVFLNLDLLCRELPAVPDLPDEFDFQGDTNRERISSVTGVGTCGEGCHSKLINPLGFALEDFDALGRFRDNDNGFPVNTADTYQFEDGREISFANSVELADQLAEAPETHACYLSHVLEFMFGRDLIPADRNVIEELAQRSFSEDIPLRELVRSIASSNNFRFRASTGGEGQ